MILLSLIFSIYSSIKADIIFLGDISSNWPTYLAMYLSIFIPTIMFYTNFKMDYIKDIKIEDEPLTPLKNVKTLGKDFNITEYINNHVYIFGGDVITAKLELISSASVMVLKDWFVLIYAFKLKAFNLMEPLI